MSSRRRRGDRHRRPHTRSQDSIIIRDGAAALPLSGCIDLTEDQDEDFVDLTSSQNTSQGTNDLSVVIIGTPTIRSPRLAERRNRRDNESESSGDLPDLELEELPLPPIDLSDVEASGSSGERPPSVTSPTQISITCPVCLDDAKAIKRLGKKIFSTTCGHVFCEDCVETAVRTNHSCPLCRKKLTSRSIHVLHI